MPSLLSRTAFTSGVLLCLYGFSSLPAPQVDYTRDVAPMMKAHCESCHNAKSPAGDLDVTSLDALRKGGASGAVIVPGKGKTSLLVQRIVGGDGRPRMPKGFAPLKPEQIKLIETWIDQGAKGSAAKRIHWAFVAPIKPPLPTVKFTTWSRNGIDRFVLARLEKEGLKPSVEADRTTLIRRVTLDLLGLPPTPAEVDAFVADTQPNSYERLVDRLLANPHYGERMALPWLDAARYADSNGFQQDGDTFQWVWRDWVVKAFNQNMPFDQFTREQLAGDLLPNPSLDQLVATGFNRNHMLNGEGGAIAEEQRNVNLYDRVDTTSTTWLGLTMTCARCHDHKYDPLSQRDFYSMMAFFNKVPESGVPSGGGQYRIADPWIYAGTPLEMKQLKELEAAVRSLGNEVKKAEKSTDLVKAEEAWISGLPTASGLPKDVSDIAKVERTKRSKEQVARLHAYFLESVAPNDVRQIVHQRKGQQDALDKLRGVLPRVMVMSDSRPRKTFIYSRGNYEAPLAEVSSDTPEALPKMTGSKDRLGLADWILSPKNPLTARVQVNRYWQQFFGKGLVRTPENFGIQSEPPTHPELLDWLAVDFRESGWNVKRFVKMIVTSATYRQSSKVDARLLKKDPDNRLLARGSRFRLPSMVLRDVALASSGLLNDKIGGQPVYPYQPAGIWDGLSITKERDFTYPQSKGADLYRRSLYSFWRRTAAPGNMFDSSARQTCTVRPGNTSTPLHALTMLNDVTWVEAGRLLATRVLKAQASPEARLREAFRLVCARRPSAKELGILRRALDRSTKAFTDDAIAKKYLSEGGTPPDAGLNPRELAAYASVCLAVLNLDEAMTRE